MGCHGLRIDDPADLTASVTTAFAADRPTVLWLPVSG
jgi:thiamine pyrophosphate-dependent acetolactate synthase large subunit-like protein